jgi:UDP-glucose 4-epimerase
MTIVGDGLQTRDFTHVSDVVEANLLAAETLNSDAFGEIMNVGAGENHSILSVAGMIGGDYAHKPARKGESEHTLADISKINKLLGWQPQIKLEKWIENENNNKRKV